MSEATASRAEAGAVAYRLPDPPTTQHQPARPAWTCTRDGEPWPCPGARVHLLSRYAGDPIRLAVHMSTLLMTAAADTGSRGVLPPELFNRFLAWTASTPSTTTSTTATMSTCTGPPYPP